jgi:hypothetical protein
MDRCDVDVFIVSLPFFLLCFFILFFIILPLSSTQWRVQGQINYPFARCCYSGISVQPGFNCAFHRNA